MAVTTYIVDKDGNQIDASKATVPANRDFRDAWSLSGTVITEDLAKSKEIFKDKIREVRQPIAKKKALRDAPAAKAITDADTIAKLKAAWDTSVLGDSPYS